MNEEPYNLPTISSDVLLAFSKYPPESGGYPHSYPVKVLFPPTVTLRAGSITGLSLSHGGSTQHTTPSADAGATPELNDIPADALTFSNVDATGSTLKVWVRIDTSGTIYWFIMDIGPGNSAAAKQFNFNADLTLGVTTSSVLNDDNETILRSGEFTFPIQLVIMDRDLPFAAANVFFEYVVGQEVDQNFSMFAPQCHVFVRKGCGYGCNFPESDIGGKIVSPDGYESGLVAETYREYDSSTDEEYTAGVRIHGTALRPGLYLAHVWSRSEAESPRLTGGLELTTFLPGETSQIIIISIRDRVQLPGDLMVMVPHDINAVPDTHLDVTFAAIADQWAYYLRDREEYTNLPIPGSWNFSPALWDDRRIGGGIDTAREDLLSWLAELLTGEDVTADNASALTSTVNSTVYPTGHVHFPGYWYRTHDSYTTRYPWHSYTWYVICRDHLNDDPAEARGLWRLYCASDSAADVLPWHVVAESAEIGLLNEYVEQNGALVASRIEVPPKFWGSPSNMCVKGAEHYIVKDNGVFAHAGYLEIELPLPEDAEEDAEPEVVTVRVFQQEPVNTVQHEGWRDLNFYPPAFTNASGKLLYDHPELGWVMVPDLATTPTEQHQVAPVPIKYVGVPYAPAAPAMVVGNNQNAIRRDMVMAAYGNDPNVIYLVRGTSVSNIDKTGPWRGSPMALLGNMAASGMFNGGIIWSHYPLTRMVNFERLRVKITATVEIELLGSPAGYNQTDNDVLVIESDAYGNPSNIPSQTAGTHHAYGKFVWRYRYSAKSTGTCAASIRLDDIPCWYNGYMLLVEARGVNVATFSGSLNTTMGVRVTETGISRDYVYDDDEDSPGWKLNHGRRGSLSMIEGAKNGTATADSCSCAVSAMIAVGHGREMNLCPPRVANSDNPADMIVFAGDVGISCTWELSGNGTFQDTLVESYTVQLNDGDGWYDYPDPPVSTPEEPTTIKLSYTVSRGWATGLQTWKLKNRDPLAQPGGDANIIQCSFDGEYRRYQQSGSYSYKVGDGGEDGYGSTDTHFANGECSISFGDGSVSGRTTAGHETPGNRVLQPKLYYGGTAECRTVVDGIVNNRSYPLNRADGDPDPDAEVDPDDGYVVDPSDTSEAANAKRAYNKYLEAVKNCKEDQPAIADYRSDGDSVRSDFEGTSGGDHRIDDISLTIEIQEG